MDNIIELRMPLIQNTEIQLLFSISDHQVDLAAMDGRCERTRIDLTFQVLNPQFRQIDLIMRSDYNKLLLHG